MNNASSDFSSSELGPLQQWEQYAYKHPSLDKAFKGKKFIKDQLGLTGMEISVNSLAAFQAVPFAHCHTHNEEVYLFIDGEGEFLAGQTSIKIQPGTVVRLAPEVERSWRNTSEQPMHYLVIQARANSLSSGEIADGIALPGNPWR